MEDNIMNYPKGKSGKEALRVMVRVNCLRAAAELLSRTPCLPEQKLTLCFAMAKRLEDYVWKNPKRK